MKARKIGSWYPLQRVIHSSGDHNSDVLFTIHEHAYKFSLENDYMIKVIMIKMKALKC